MKNIQKEWKGVGFVPRKLDNKLWAEFSEVHKTFFDRIKSGYQHLNEEQEALKKEKTAQIDKLNTTEFSDDPEQLIADLASLWEQWNSMDKIGGQTELELNKKFTYSLSKVISGLSLDKKTQKDVQLKLDALLLQNDPNKLQKQLNEVRGNLDKLKNERTQLENNLEFFSDSSSENPLYKNVEKQINSCQKKIDKAQEEYIRLKQIKNAQIKLANQEIEQTEQAEEDQDSAAE
jgi:DNA repair exonuclease SbcCD ATPase subunit